MQTRRIFKNAWMAVLQVLVTGLALFFLYYFLLKAIGVELLGVWSLVLATSSVVQIGNLGLSGSVVKFVAKYVARKEMAVAAEVIETAAISLGFAFLALLVILYPVLLMLLELALPTDNLGDALSLLPFAVVTLWVAVVTGTFQSGLDGCQRIDLRSMLTIAGSILNLVFTIVFVQAYGFIGLGYAQVLQASLLLVASWVVLRWELKELPFIPHRWKRGLFMEMLLYGINFQLSSIAIMLYEPATKWLMSYFGGLTMTGYYEMASRMVNQFRAVLVAANQVLVPVIAGFEETDPKKSAMMYVRAFRLMLFLALPYYAAIMVAIPLISQIWIGKYEVYFVVFSMLLIASNFINTVNAPAYFSFMGIGHLRWTLVAHIVIAVLNVGLGALLGMLYSGVGVAVGAALALVVGSNIIMLKYHSEENVSWLDLRITEHAWLAVASIVGATIGLLTYFHFQPDYSILIISLMMIAAFLFCVLPVVWFHPIMRFLLRGWMNKKQVQF